MNKKLFNVLMFTMGAAVGSLVTWKVLKTKYERIAQEEIDSVKETWARLAECDADEHTNDDVAEHSDICEEEHEFNASVYHEYHTLADRYNTSGNDAEKDEEGEGDDEVPYINGPYVITPDEYGDGNYNHSLYCLTYYDDDVLANDWDEVFDIEETIGQDALEHFGDHVDDVVHVRNERLQADYEVVRDYRTYREVATDNPLKHGHAN